MHVLTCELEALALPSHLAGKESVLTIGAFDGVHLGHQALIRRLVEHARSEGRQSGLVTFYPHPASILHPQRPVSYLTTPGEKAASIEPFELDWMAVLLFTPQLADTSPRQFMQRLYDQVSMRGVWVGPDFALGRNRSGDVSSLRQLGREMGFQVHEMPYVTEEGEKVSSTHIRLLVRRGHVEEARRLLGRSYSVSGEVVHGAQRGRCLGYPTANVAVPAERVVPANGIYASVTRLGPDRYPSVTSIGVRPTFDNGERSIETHLLDYHGDLYGRDLVVEFVARLRPEKRFSEVSELVAQIERDVAATREVLDALQVAEQR